MLGSQCWHLYFSSPNFYVPTFSFRWRWARLLLWQEVDVIPPPGGRFGSFSLVQLLKNMPTDYQGIEVWIIVLLYGAYLRKTTITLRIFHRLTGQEMAKGCGGVGVGKETTLLHSQRNIYANWFHTLLFKDWSHFDIVFPFIYIECCSFMEYKI